MRKNQYLALMLLLFLLVGLVKIPAIPVSYQMSHSQGDGHGSTSHPSENNTSDPDIGEVGVKKSNHTTPSETTSPEIGVVADRVGNESGGNGSERVLEATAISNREVFGWSLQTRVRLHNPHPRQQTYEVIFTVRNASQISTRQRTVVDIAPGANATASVTFRDLPYRSEWPTAYTITVRVRNTATGTTSRASITTYRRTLTVWEYLRRAIG